MIDRRVAVILSGLVAALALALMFRAFARPTPRIRAAPTSAPPVRVAPADSAARRESVARAAAPTPAPPVGQARVAQPLPSGPGAPSYIVLLARSELRRRIRASAQLTYLNDIVAASTDSVLHRWDGRMQSAVRVYLASSVVANFQPGFLEAVRTAFERWEQTGVAVAFKLDADSAAAEVQVQWRIQFEGARSGLTTPEWDEEGHLKSGIVSFLTHATPDGGAATLAQALDARVQEGELVERLPGGAVRCFACGHRCLVKPGRRGICKVRYNKDGTLFAPAGYVAALQCDPTEKKPFFHVLPGSDTLTFGMLGCDFHCGYCQNWLTSQALRDDAARVLPTDVTPEALVGLARRQGAKLVGAAYNEPLITGGGAVAVFKVAKARGLKTAFISNGNATPEVLDYIRPWTDCYKIDFKAMDDRRYRARRRLHRVGEP